MKSPTTCTRVRDATDFFETVILLYDRPLSLSHRLPFFHASTGSGRVYLIRPEERIAKERVAARGEEAES